MKERSLVHSFIREGHLDGKAVLAKANCKWQHEGNGVFQADGDGRGLRLSSPGWNSAKPAVITQTITAFATLLPSHRRVVGEVVVSLRLETRYIIAIIELLAVGLVQ